jgi:hypothetical protein
MTNQDQKLRQLLQLKKSETPGPAYFDAFLDEFHRYQRAEILKQPTLVEKASALLSSWMEALHFRPQPALAAFGGSMAVALLLGFLAIGHFSATDPSTTLASSADAAQGYVTTPAATAPLVSQPEELSLVTVSSFDQDFGSPRYVTGQTPGTYDSALAF